MTVTITLSEIVVNNLQSDGRSVIREHHKDSLGVDYYFDYINDGSIDINQHLANDAAIILPNAATSEIANNINIISTLGMNAHPITVYSTSAQSVAALYAAWPNFTNTQAIYTGEYLNTLNDAQIEAAFGFTQQQADTYRASYWVPYATIAASLRSTNVANW